MAHNNSTAGNSADPQLRAVAVRLLPQLSRSVAWTGAPASVNKSLRGVLDANATFPAEPRQIAVVCWGSGRTTFLVPFCVAGTGQGQAALISLMQSGGVYGNEVAVPGYASVEVRGYALPVTLPAAVQAAGISATLDVFQFPNRP